MGLSIHYSLKSDAARPGKNHLGIGGCRASPRPTKGKPVAKVNLMTAKGGRVAILVLHTIPTADPSDYICSPPDILSHDEVKAITWELQCGKQEGWIGGYRWEWQK